MVRPYKIGKRKVSQAEFDAEVLRLMRLGLRQNEIGHTLNLSRHTVGRAMARLETHGKAEVDQAKVEGEYQRLSKDSFRGLSEVKTWIETLLARRLGNWRNQVNILQHICDDLGIYPRQLDLHYGVKYLAGKGNRSSSQLREFKIVLRNWLKYAHGTSDAELKAKGLDARHYEVGKYAHVAQTEEQIKEMDNLLSVPTTRLVYRLGVECCMPLQELKALEGEHILWQERILRTYRKKTDGWWSKYPSNETLRLLAELLGVRPAMPKVFRNGDLERARTELREAFLFKVGSTGKYFSMRPLHALRHIGAQRLLRKLHWNRAIVAKLGGWEAEKTLEDHYGAVPDEVIDQAGRSLW